MRESDKEHSHARAHATMIKHPEGAVAIIDDDQAVLDSLKFLLELSGHKVVTYSSAEAFLEDAEVSPRGLILDHHMPHMTGLELAARLRTQNVRLPILLITGSPSPGIVTRAAELGVQILDKPPEERDLLRFLETNC